MFPGLGHDTVIGGYHQQSQVDARHPPHHVLDEPVMPGDIYQRYIIGEEGEADVDGHAPALLLRLGVGIHPGQRPHQGGLAVVDVARQPDHYLPQSTSSSVSASRWFFSAGMAFKSI